MQKLADLSVFEQLEQRQESSLSVFNESYEKATNNDYNVFYMNYNAFSQACFDFRESLEELGRIYEELEDDGVFDERPKLRAPLLRAIEKYKDKFSPYERLWSEAVNEWKDTCYYGKFYGTLRQFPNTQGYSIESDLPPEILQAAKDALIDASQKIESKLVMGAMDVVIDKGELDKRIERYKKLIKSLD